MTPKAQNHTTKAAKGQRVYSNKSSTAGSLEKIRARDRGMHLAEEKLHVSFRGCSRAVADTISEAAAR